jgi:hypothetical protein
LVPKVWAMEEIFPRWEWEFKLSLRRQTFDFQTHT